MSDWVRDPGWVATALSITIPHEAHASYVQAQTEFDIKNASVTGYVTWCEDCDWSESFMTRDHSRVLWAWHEAARARDIHHDTHDKEIEE